MFKKIFFVVIFGILSACGGGSQTVISGDGSSSVDISALNGADGVSYASLIIPTFCSDGQAGFEYQTGPDTLPPYGVLTQEEVTSNAFVCPPPFKSGYAFRLTRFENDELLCPNSLSGVLLEIGLSQDGGIYLGDKDKVIKAVPICDGEKGNDGEQGPQVDVAKIINGINIDFSVDEFVSDDGLSCESWSFSYSLGLSEVDDSSDINLFSFCESSNFMSFQNDAKQLYSIKDMMDSGEIRERSLAVSLKNMTHKIGLLNKGAFATVIEFDIKYYRPNKDAIVGVYFVKSGLNFTISDPNPESRENEYTFRFPLNSFEIPKGEIMVFSWQSGPENNIVTMKDLRIYGHEKEDVK